jgi:hippurate hydrolase
MTLQPAPSLFQGVDPDIAAGIDEFVEIRRDLHRRPELAFKETRTSGIIARLLAEWGYEVTTGIGKTGVVATLRRGAGPKALAIRADFDALPIKEETGLSYASENAGVMHACGHDGHTTILRAAARRLAASGAFQGALHLVFQPAEEIGAGASALIKDGLFERFPVDAIYGLHNWPNVPVGQFGFVIGPAMASVDGASVRVRGRGGHGAAPHEAVDPVVAAAHIVTALQTVVSRNVDPLDVGVVTVATIHGGEATNVIPEWVDLKLTTRSFRPEIRSLLQARVPALIRAQAESFGAEADVDYQLGFPSLVNHAAETELIVEVARETFGEAKIAKDFRPRTASEDFAFYLEQRDRGASCVGNGDGPTLHSASYNFNDDIIGPAATLWVRLAERFLS